MQLGQTIAGSWLCIIGLSPFIIAPKYSMLPILGNKVTLHLVADNWSSDYRSYSRKQQYYFEQQGEKVYVEVSYASSGGVKRIKNVYVWPDDPEVFALNDPDGAWMGILVFAGAFPFGLGALIYGLFSSRDKNGNEDSPN